MQSSADLISLIDEIEEIIESSRPPLFSGQGKKIIDEQDILAILDEIRDRFPQEFQDARRIVKEQNDILAAANNQAQMIVGDAQQQAMVLAGDQEIARLAQQAAEEVRQQAEQFERDTRYSAGQYADGVLAQLEANLNSMRESVTHMRTVLEQNSEPRDPNTASW